MPISCSTVSVFPCGYISLVIVLNLELWCAFVNLSYFRSLNQLNFCVNGFKAFIIPGNFSTSNYEVLCSILLSFTSCGFPFIYVLTLFKLLHRYLMHNSFFPQSLHFYFICLYLTHSIFFSFMNIKIIDVEAFKYPSLLIM